MDRSCSLILCQFYCQKCLRGYELLTSDIQDSLKVNKENKNKLSVNKRCTRQRGGIVSNLKAVFKNNFTVMSKHNILQALYSGSIIIFCCNI